MGGGAEVGWDESDGVGVGVGLGVWVGGTGVGWGSGVGSGSGKTAIGIPAPSKGCSDKSASSRAASAIISSLSGAICSEEESGP